MTEIDKRRRAEEVMLKRSDEVSGGSMSGEVNVDVVKVIGERRSFGEGIKNTRWEKKKKKKGKVIVVCLI
ncbi:hypothetical protein QJS10_CPB17g00511 [Acorus calamus]|uniref:Uncharacterized protein n=1 Tax=Acorus calamus TaxID=4465 RepID=A0AAV9CRZ5_ACOCL|nr:hypothetical protein QJS10_CPB17g00511 [Acorus calamus]